MKDEKYVITYLKGEKVVVKEVEETEEELKERIEFYQSKGYTVISVRKQVVIITYEDVKFGENN